MPFRTHNRCAHLGAPNTGSSSPTWNKPPAHRSTACRTHGACWTCRDQYVSARKHASETFLPHSVDTKCSEHAEWASSLSSTGASACTCSCTATVRAARSIARASTTHEHELRHATCTKCEPIAARTYSRCSGLRDAAAGTATTGSPQPADAAPADAAAAADAATASASAPAHAATGLVWSFATGSNARHESEFGWRRLGSTAIESRFGRGLGRRRGRTTIDALGQPCASATCSSREACWRSNRRTYGISGH